MLVDRYKFQDLLPCSDVELKLMGHPVSPSMVTGLVLSYCSWKFPRPVISLKVLHKAHRDIIFTIIMTSKSYCENNISMRFM